jgi:hypothetical protein
MYEEDFSSCIDPCHDAVAACHRCAAACLKQPGTAKTARCIQLNAECAQICRLAAGYLSRHSELAIELCTLCAAACELCSQECAQQPVRQCQESAAACRRCAQAYRTAAYAQAKLRAAPMPAVSVH